MYTGNVNVTHTLREELIEIRMYARCHKILLSNSFFADSFIFVAQTLYASRTHFGLHASRVVFM